MGCWNETCFVSNLPIRSGDAIAYIPLVKYYNSWGAISLPLHGKYDDYGCVEYVTNLSTLDYYRNEMKKYVDLDSINENHPSSTVDSLVKAIERGEASEKYEYGFVMAHASMFNKLVDSFGSRKLYDRNWTLRDKFENFYMQDIEDLESLSMDSDVLKRLTISNCKLVKILSGENSRLGYMAKLLYSNRNETLKQEIIDYIVFRNALLFGRIDMTPRHVRSQLDDYGISMLIASEVMIKTNDRYKDYIDAIGETITMSEFLEKECLS